MFLFTLFFLIAVLYLFQCSTYKCVTSEENSNDALRQLQCRFFAVYLPATFADWLQGPYMYKLYSYYGFREDEIFLLYMAGFASSFIFGTCVSGLADYCGRRLMCIVFNVIYLLSCLSKLSSSFKVLFVGRILGGIGTSILFSVFEAWYVYQHVEKHQLPLSWLNNTLSKATFYNGLLAIISGLISNLFADVLEMGPVIPFLLAVPCLIFSGSLAFSLWDEASTLQNMCWFDVSNMLKISFKKEVLLLCLIQSIFESVMYVFIVLWTPILSPVSPPLGIVFSCFMLCIMIGSTLHKWLVAKKYKPNSILPVTMLLASVALGACALSETSFPDSCVYTCFLAFLLFEVSVGLYYPVIGFIRSCVLPEAYRATLTSCFRLPVNFITCFSLFYFLHSRGTERSNSNRIVHESNSNQLSNNVQIFTVCALVLLGASVMAKKLPVFLDQRETVLNVHNY
ncbi:hypothetical protein R5R35_007931 [Gryllus longicercus]|uniref:Molybdate-anion transporter n=1 Tax=Gryllus longicercus TaxID=2509291 RepID=A0AAN9VJK6_9ORTH